MRMSEVMSAPVTTVAPNVSIERAWNEMQLARVHHLVVVERGGIRGIVSSHDLATAPRSATVAEHMSTGVVTAEPHTTVREAANLLRGRAIGCLPIVEREKLVGIVTVSDLLELLGRGGLMPTPRSERATLARRGAARAKTVPADRRRR